MKLIKFENPQILNCLIFKFIRNISTGNTLKVVAYNKVTFSAC